MIKLPNSSKQKITTSILSNQALLIDFDGTLVDYAQSERGALDKLFSYCKLSTELYSSAKDYYKKVNAFYWSEFEKKNLTIEEVQRKRFEDLITKFSLDNDPMDLNKRYLQFFIQSTSIDPKVRLALKELKTIGIKLVVITNGIHWTQTERIKNCGLDHLIDKFFTSESVGFAKPHPKMFTDSIEFLKSINCPTNDLWVIGDNFDADIRGAHDVGFSTCWIHNSDSQNLPETIPDTNNSYPTMSASSFLEFAEFYKNIKLDTK